MNSKNSSDKKVILKPGRDKAVRNWHHWIFSGAVKAMPEFSNGDIMPVHDSGNNFLGYAYFNNQTSIIGRMLSFDNTPGEEAVVKNIQAAIGWRQEIFNDKKTNAYRLVNAEGDFIPGLIVDQYNRSLVIQISTLGIEKLKPLIIKTLIEELAPKCIYEKSRSASRQEEGLAEFEGVLTGQLEDDINIKENGFSFSVNIKDSQKTGFYLDQREMRQLIRHYSKNRRILNCFCYTGGFTVYALAGQATAVDSVDVSSESVEAAKQNVQLNDFKANPKNFYLADVFDYLHDVKSAYDMIILDPPAFAKKKTDVVSACRGYKEINRLALKKIKPNGYVLTSSCSHFVDEKLFQTVVFQAAREAGRRVRIIQRHHLAPDHPINIFHPESEYLKSLFLYVE